MEQSLRQVLIELTKKHKINKNDNFLFSKDGKTFLCKMLSDKFKVISGNEELNNPEEVQQLSVSDLPVDKFLERYSTIGYRSKDLLDKEETLNPRISVIYQDKGSKIRVHKLSDNQAKIAVNVMNHLNQEIKQKQKAKITVR